MASESPKVFISYSHDSIQHNDLVLSFAERLRKDGIDAQIDQYVGGRPPGGWPRWMLDRLDWAGFVLLICTETYYRRFRGHEEPDKGKGVDWEGQLITLEIYHARGRTTKFVPVLFGSQNEEFIPEPLRDHPYRLDSEDSYQELYGFLTGQAGVPLPKLGVVKTLPRNAVEPLRFESSKAECRSMGKLHGVPELPPHYLSRSADLVGLKQKLLAGDASVAITGQGQALGVQGMGGIGKTVLAAALAYDLEVRKAFPDGIYWLTVGQKPSVLLLQGQLLQRLGVSERAVNTVQEGKDILREAFEARRVLVVVDDVWTIDHADAFSVTAPLARLLITTRNNEVLVGLGAEQHRVDVLSPSDALKMLAEWVGEKSPDKLPAEAAEVARECGYLPLALAMIGAMIRLRPTAWKDALGRLQRADLEAVKRNFPAYPYSDLLRAIEVSIDALELADQERYLDLAVFPEDQLIPEGPLAILWKLDETQTRDCMTHFVARSLATWATDGTSLILHDLQRDLIHKRREKELPGLHLRLVEVWDALPKLRDAYAWRWVGYHMVKAGRGEELRQLLLDFNYLEAKLAATDTNALIADYDYLAVEEDLRLIQSALRLSAHVLVRDHRHLAGQLTGRLLGIADDEIEALLKQAAEKTRLPWLRPLRANLTSPGGPLIRMLEGHSASVNGVAIAPAGDRAISASWDHTLRVWDLQSGKTVRTLEGHNASVYGVAIARVGGRAVSASRDKTLRVWDLESSQAVHTLKGHSDSVNGVAITPDGDRAVSASSDKTLRVWNLESSQTVRTLKGHNDSVYGVAITPDGDRAISASWDHTLRVWDLESGQSVRTLKGHTDSVNGVAITPDGAHAVSASSDKTLRVWDLESGQTVRTLEGHTYWVNGVAITPDGARAISASWDHTLRVWDLKSGQTVRTLKGHSDSINGVAIMPGGGRAVSASWDHTLRVWDLKSDQTVRTLKGHSDWVNGVAITPDGGRAVSASSDYTLWVWDLESGQTMRALEGHTYWVNGVAITPDGRRAVSASRDKTLRVWDLESGQTVRTLKGHSDWVNGVAITPDGGRAISASWDHTLRVWNLETGQTVRVLEGHTYWVTGVAITPDGRCAVSASRDKTLRVWDLESGQTVRTLENHDSSVTAVAITPDGRRAVSASRDKTLRVWNLENGQTVRTLEGHSDWVTGVAITPDGRRAVSASRDKTLRVWDIQSGEELALLTADASATACAVSSDSRTIVAGDAAGNMHILRMEGFKT